MLGIRLSLNIVTSVGSDPQEWTDTIAAAFLCHSSGNWLVLLNVLVEVERP